MTQIGNTTKKKYIKECFGSRLEITIIPNQNIDSAIAESFCLIDDFEQKYSRFIPGNILSSINKKKHALLEKEIASLVLLCTKVSELTSGYFDITVLPLLENSGYGIASNKLQESIGYKNIILDNNILTLKNDINIEFGACGKGYAVDLIYNALMHHSNDFVVNFGGDIRVAGKHTIYLEDPGDISKNIGCIDITDMSIASSSGNRRQLTDNHHIINPKTKVSENTILAVYVTHKLGVFADVFSTALFVSPLEVSKRVIKKVSGLEALIILSDGTIYQSPGFRCQLTI